MSAVPRHGEDEVGADDEGVESTPGEQRRTGGSKRRDGGRRTVTRKNKNRSGGLGHEVNP